MTDQIKYNQIPAITLNDVGKRMTHGHKKHGDYRKRMMELPRFHYLDHLLWHIEQFYDIKKRKLKDNPELFTGSGDSHALAIACDAMIFYESEKERGMLQIKEEQ